MEYLKQGDSMIVLDWHINLAKNPISSASFQYDWLKIL